MHALEIDDLHASHGRLKVLAGVSVAVERGEWFCVLGPNGAGKSTLLDCAVGRLAPSSGDVRIGGHSLARERAAAKRALGYACAPGELPPLLTGRQCLTVYAFAKELEAIDADVLELADELRLTPFLDAYVDTYSLGTRQKLCVLLALLGDPQIVVLDEAFNGLDPRSALVLKRRLRERLALDRCAVLLATHSLDIVERYADAAALLHGGTIVERWTAKEIRRLRAQAEGGFERALAAASEAG